MPQWRKSKHSFSNGNCVEAASWRKSTRCQTGECVEAGQGAGAVGVRDSQDPDGGLLEVTPAAWRAFTAGLKAAAA